MCRRCPASGTSVAQRVGRPQRPFGLRRHLHEVDVHVQQAGVVAGRRPAPSPAPARASASTVSAPSAGSPVVMSHSCHGVRFISASANSAATSRSSRMRAVHLAHRVGVGVVPHRVILGRLVAGIALPASGSISARSTGLALPRRASAAAPRREPSPATASGRPGRTPPMACCSSGRRRRRRPNRPWRRRDRRPRPGESSARPPRDCSRSTR